MSNPNTGDGENESKTNINRRAFSMGASAIGLSTAGVPVVTGSVSAGGPSEYTEQQQEIYETNKEHYGAEEAKILTDKFVELENEGRVEGVSSDEKEEAYSEFTKYLIDNTEKIAEAIKRAEREADTKGQSTRSDIPIPQSTDLSPTITDENASGTGLTQTRFLTGNIMEASCISAGYGNAVAWVERAGFYYPDSSGDFEVTCDYQRNGNVSSNGSATITLFVEELEGNRRTEIVDRGGNEGSVSRSAGFALSGQTDYLVGLRLNTEIQGIGYDVFSDYYAALNQVQIDSLSIDEI
ncbi:DUF4200 domain-containing protein [Halorubrum sp. Atlit-28R]|uniref:DUF4200 domain-containing protein n=1 Tax=Halorubrum sp. Atlit-28R TaxID=2282129 RepID=UPI0011C4291B|nr:DUF4200 domain-containing protein [Halorubrum sp. Atlit-28R]